MEIIIRQFYTTKNELLKHFRKGRKQFTVYFYFTLNCDSGLQNPTLLPFSFSGFPETRIAYAPADGQTVVKLFPKTCVVAMSPSDRKLLNVGGLSGSSAVVYKKSKNKWQHRT